MSFVPKEVNIDIYVPLMYGKVWLQTSSFTPLPDCQSHQVFMLMFFRFTEIAPWNSAEWNQQALRDQSFLYYSDPDLILTST